MKFYKENTNYLELTTINKDLAQKNYCQLTVPIAKEVLDYVYNHGFKIFLSAGDFKITSISHVKVEGDKDLVTANNDKEGVATVIAGHGLKEQSVMSLQIKFIAENPGWISTSPIYITITKQYDREILLVSNTGSTKLATILKKLEPTMSLGLGWGVKVPSTTDTETLLVPFDLPENHPFKIFTSSDYCKTA